MTKVLTKTKTEVLPEFEKLMATRHLEFALARAQELNIPARPGPYLGELEAPMITEKGVYEPFIPESTTASHIHPEAARIVTAMARSGVPIQQVVVFHEHKPAYEAPEINIDWDEVKAATEPVLKVAAMVARGIAHASLALLILPLLVIDPIVYIVLPSGEWIECARWDTVSVR